MHCAQAARQVNQLEGAAREVMLPWLQTARTTLEVVQALKLIRAYVAVLGVGDKTTSSTTSS